MIKKLFLFLFTVVLFAGLAAGGVLYHLVVVEPGPEISQDNIRRILGKESPVFYRDGTTPLGVFFADSHRRYLEYREIPQHFVNALVAAEDNRFFSHFGFDVIGIARAAIANIEAGRIVQGGSTLSQQTAKNLFKREERSFRAKFKELLYALRLEYHYSKEQILEFYANQFYVSGNRVGLGVAARYYFDKEPEQLNLIEAAFIAGSVKRPNAYNPFIKKTPEEAARAEERATERVRYVLDKMLELGMISAAVHQQSVATPIPFNKGTVGFPLDYVMALVTDAVDSEMVRAALAEHRIDNITTSGVRIITTVDRDLQRFALAALRDHLSYLDVRLRGYNREEVQKEIRELDYSGDLLVEPGAFLFGTVQSVTGSGKEIEIIVDLGGDRGVGIIDGKGLEQIVEALAKWRQHRWSEAAAADYAALLAQITVGDRLWVSVREIGEGSTVWLDLERYPLVQGAAVVMRQGRMVAVVGGTENRFYNRAVYGKRTMGSSFKPFVYAAALQLGWSSADILNNQRNVFVYQNLPYFPRPDHDIEHQQVSMSWAGVKSENLASVWLTAHLCDRLTSDQFHEVADHLGLTPRVVDGQSEPYNRFVARIRDRYGIVLNRDKIRQAAYRKTVQTIETDLIFEGLVHELETLQSLPYGLGFTSFRDQINRDLDDGGSGSEEELQLRRALLNRSFLHLANLRRQLDDYLGEAGSGRLDEADRAFGAPIRSGTAQLVFHQSSDSYHFINPASMTAGMTPIQRTSLLRHLLSLSDAERYRFIGRIRLGNLLSVRAFDFVERQVEAEYQRLKELAPYSMEVLEHVEDYRILVGLQYLLALGESTGIRSGLEPVLSFPLGSNSVTLLETTRIYETMVSGETHLFVEQDGSINESLGIIDRIETEEGVVVFRPQMSRRRLVSPKVSMALGHILENTVKFGTGRYADQQVKLRGAAGEGLGELELSVPLLGKTGTANRYTNASFFGYLPAIGQEGSGLTLDDGFSIGVYVGYDDNQPMRRTSTRVTGSLGALPAWTTIVERIVGQQAYATDLDPVDLSFYGLGIKRRELGQKNVKVSDEQGGRAVVPMQLVDPLDRYQPSILTFGSPGPDGAFQPERSFAPFWAVEEPSPVASEGLD